MRACIMYVCVSVCVCVCLSLDLRVCAHAHACLSECIDIITYVGLKFVYAWVGVFCICLHCLYSCVYLSVTEYRLNVLISNGVSFARWSLSNNKFRDVLNQLFPHCIKSTISSLTLTYQVLAGGVLWLFSLSSFPCFSALTFRLEVFKRMRTPLKRRRSTWQSGVDYVWEPSNRI